MEREEPNFYNLYHKVGNIEGRLNTIEKNINTVMGNHEGRINKVEGITDRLVGKASIVGTITGFVGGIIVSLINHFTQRS